MSYYYFGYTNYINENTLTNKLRYQCLTCVFSHLFLISCWRYPHSLFNLLEYSVTYQNFMSALVLLKWNTLLYGIPLKEYTSHGIPLNFVCACESYGQMSRGCVVGSFQKNMVYKRQIIGLSCHIVFQFFGNFMPYPVFQDSFENGSQNFNQNQHKKLKKKIWFDCWCSEKNPSRKTKYIRKKH